MRPWRATSRRPGTIAMRSALPSIECSETDFYPGSPNVPSSPARCCAACVKSTLCTAWNTNTAQQACHFRTAIGTPNRSPICNFGVVRPPPPPPPPPPPIKPAPAGAKNVLVIVCDDFRPFIAPWTHRYGIKAPNLEKLASESMVFNNTYVQQAVCGPSRTYSVQH